jgi:hypothetical protein
LQLAYGNALFASLRGRWFSPTASFPVAIRYDRFTSEPAVRFASIGGVRLVATNVFLTSKAAAFFVQGL